VGILSWWYGDGFLRRIQITQKRLISSADIFSISLLIRTLFNPFRQISVDATGASLPEKIRAFFDRLLSRIIGAIVRSFMILFGSMFIFLRLILEVIMITFWLFMPILPVIGAILMVLGWMI
jgi:hypothetical protein